VDIIDYNVFNHAEINQTPFYWGLQDNLINKAMQNILLQQFPTDNFVPASRTQGEGKHYKFEVLNIISHNDVQDAFYQLSNDWQKFITELASTRYLSALSNFLQINFNAYSVDVGLFRFNPQDWVEVHTDRPDKILTQLFYFNDNWADDWGGELYILAEPHLSSVLSKVKPSVDRSAIIVRSDAAWHYVSPVAEIAKFPRLSLQVEIIKR
jgi:Rps23 Pro-64 3,4-dihydroxylase Tpa1-like proline 4-hydroxylase